MCSSAARLRIAAALISDNAELIRMRAEITAEEMLPNQKGKQPEGALKNLGRPRTPRLIEGNTLERRQPYTENIYREYKSLFQVWYRAVTIRETSHH